MQLDLQALTQLSPAELAEHYRGGRPPAPAWLKERVAGRMLASGAPALLERLGRPVFRAYAELGPFEGKSFSPDGKTGANRMLGQDRLPFRCALQPSVLDAQATLRLSYDSPENPALLRGLFDELRQLDERVAIGPALLKLPLGRSQLLFWFGVEAI